MLRSLPNAPMRKASAASGVLIADGLITSGSSADSRSSFTLLQPIENSAVLTAAAASTRRTLFTVLGVVMLGIRPGLVAEVDASSVVPRWPGGEQRLLRVALAVVLFRVDAGPVG